MAQLMMQQDIIDSPSLRLQITKNVEDIELVLPEGAPLIVHIKRVSKHLFGAHFRARLLGRQVVVRAYDQNLFHALSRARKSLLRQVDDIRQLRREEARPRRTSPKNLR